MPLDIIKLRNSETWLVATADEIRAALSLWMAAWHQVPAGSLPNDERILARLSEAGTEWGIVRDVSLRGFKLHSDGKLYHDTICEAALGVFETMEARRRGGKSVQRKRKLRQLSSSSAASSPTNSTQAQPGQSSSSAQAAARGKERKGNTIEQRRQGMRSIPPRAREAETAAALLEEDDFPIKPEEPENDSQIAEPNGEDRSNDPNRVGEAIELQERLLRIIGTNGTNTEPCHTVLGWLNAGYDPEIDIVPTVEHIAGRDGFTPPARLKYFTKAIAAAYHQRTAEHVQPPDIPAGLDRRGNGKSAAEMHAENARMICQLHDGAWSWDTFAHGPPPGQPGSHVPLEIALECLDPELTARLGLEYPCAPAEPAEAEG